MPTAPVPDRLLEKLPCPACQAGKSRVVDSRPFRGWWKRVKTSPCGVWRIRQCCRCGNKFTTREVIYSMNSAPERLEIAK